MFVGERIDGLEFAEGIAGDGKGRIEGEANRYAASGEAEGVSGEVRGEGGVNGGGYMDYCIGIVCDQGRGIMKVGVTPDQLPGRPF